MLKTFCCAFLFVLMVPMVRAAEENVSSTTVQSPPLWGNSVAISSSPKPVAVEISTRPVPNNVERRVQFTGNISFWSTAGVYDNYQRGIDSTRAFLATYGPRVLSADQKVLNGYGAQFAFLSPTRFFGIAFGSGLGYVVGPTQIIRIESSSGPFGRIDYKGTFYSEFLTLTGQADKKVRVSKHAYFSMGGGLGVARASLFAKETNRGTGGLTYFPEQYSRIRYGFFWEAYEGIYVGNENFKVGLRLKSAQFPSFKKDGYVQPFKWHPLGIELSSAF